ncbi:Serine phosphatase RsbU, regulator of sigma subunit [Actinacidiphila yanglinensis]|uniref:Serine phosphatase RsbU, regulator of sigma subunit n=1 Tax=Actinacidiphila yanglinensis TaxID=310779 RepID=A0A1H6E8N1_9ACTN|nr:PP2C family protein-serine/threonine phosphatase [Actinacidiphila yanglinensis]SEG94090.1 Serine phosphatase RsbU, regulator of sigma subunit [Actinacidiphila yanglinensis]
MKSSGADGRPVGGRTWKSRPILLTAALVSLAVLLGVDLIGSDRIRIGGLLVAVPALAAVFLGPLDVLMLSVLTVGAVIWASADNSILGTANFPVLLASAVLVGAGAVLAARIRARRERQLAKVRMVAEATQRALLRPLPGRLGRVTISSMYLAAEEEAAIGGDLYAAGVDERGNIRVLVGDVQGKGLAAVEVVGLLLSTFRVSARSGVPLESLPSYLDQGLRYDLVDLEENGAPGTIDSRPVETEFLERFVTAVIVDIADDASTVRIANCGHPPPILIRGDRVIPLLPDVPELPLGLGDLGRSSHHVDSYDLALGDILLLYTDGVIEARNPEGAFYPLADRLAHRTRDTPTALLEDIRNDLTQYTAGLSDDIVMLALQRVA